MQLTRIIRVGGTLSPALMDLLHIPEHQRCKNVYVLLQNNGSKFMQSKIIAVVQKAKKKKKNSQTPNSEQFFFLNLLFPDCEF